jgi:hypothetical protein
MKNSLLLILGLVIVIVATSSAAAQSKDRDHPTPIKSNELNGELKGHQGESFYSFTAGPGELMISVDVKSSQGSVAMSFELLSENGADVLLCCQKVQADAPGKIGLDLKSVTLKRQQTVILHLTEHRNRYARGTFHVRLSGSVAFAARKGERQQMAGWQWYR